MLGKVKGAALALSASPITRANVSNQIALTPEKEAWRKRRIGEKDEIADKGCFGCFLHR
jgi:hypothetical protein